MHQNRCTSNPAHFEHEMDTPNVSAKKTREQACACWQRKKTVCKAHSTRNDNEHESTPKRVDDTLISLASKASSFSCRPGHHRPRFCFCSSLTTVALLKRDAMFGKQSKTFVAHVVNETSGNVSETDMIFLTLCRLLVAHI